MAARRGKDPSPAKSAIVHAGFSLGAFGAAAAVAAGAIHMLGDEADAGPKHVIALFEPKTDEAPPPLKARLSPDLRSASGSAAISLASTEPSLGVPDPVDRYGAPREPAPVEQGSATATIRINGKPVRAGQRYSEVAEIEALPRAPIAGLYERASVGRLPIVAADGRAPADAYARPFENPDGRPAVSVILGGLGINTRRTLSAIEELPPEVTLSFVPYASNLQGLIRKARQHGHEVLIEVPMEPYGADGSRPYSHRLDVDRTPEDNQARLEYLLSRTSGYYGVINHQGEKFATSPEAAGPIADILAARGLAFVEDGSLRRSVLGDVAAEKGTRFARADKVIDIVSEAEAIEAKLLALETKALQDGAALGSGFAFPLTIDILKEWTVRLEEKGFVLAPASSMSPARTPAPTTAQIEPFQTGQTATGRLGGEG
ncbi:MAG: divergent polysaccharide deacetylase family protein [Pseudomonadota bacterium]